VAPASARPWQAVLGGLSLRLRLTPKGGRDALEGVDHLADGSCVLKARVRAAPHEGAANAALCVLVAKTLGVAAGQVTIRSGASGRIKVLQVAGETAALAARLERLTESVAA
jgi:uncharacterized protein YggU (UPF0235/DUF167 family)